MGSLKVTRAGWALALSWGLAATLAAMGLMFWARAAFQIRTLPERMMEWLLLFVPPEQFEQGLQRFGPQAKVLALIAGVVVMGAILLGLGTLALRRGWPGAAILGLSLSLYLVATGLLLPLTGAGLFGADLLQHPVLVNATYLGSALAYGTVLLAGQARAPAPAAGPGTVAPAPGGGDRRALVLGAAGTAGAYALAHVQATRGTTSGSDLPLAQLPGRYAQPHGGPHPHGHSPADPLAHGPPRAGARYGVTRNPVDDPPRAKRLSLAARVVHSLRHLRERGHSKTAGSG